jgi:hypothetical protein
LAARIILPPIIKNPFRDLLQTERLCLSGTQYTFENFSAPITAVFFVNPLSGREAENKVRLTGCGKGKTFSAAGKTHAARNRNIGTGTGTFSREAAEKFQYAIALIEERVENRRNHSQTGIHLHDPVVAAETI